MKRADIIKSLPTHMVATSFQEDETGDVISYVTEPNPPIVRGPLRGAPTAAASQNARAEEALRFTQWLRRCARDLADEGDHEAGYRAARLAVLVAREFGAVESPLAIGVPQLFTDADDTAGQPTKRATYAGLLPDEEER